MDFCLVIFRFILEASQDFRFSGIKSDIAEAKVFSITHKERSYRDVAEEMNLSITKVFN